MKENTLQDIVDQLNQVIENLEFFIESEAMDTEYLCQKLEEIRDTISETID